MNKIKRITFRVSIIFFPSCMMKKKFPGSECEAHAVQMAAIFFLLHL